MTLSPLLKSAQANLFQIIWRHVGSDDFGIASLGQETLKDVDEVLLWPSDVFALMDQGSKFFSIVLVPTR